MCMQLDLRRSFRPEWTGPFRKEPLVYEPNLFCAIDSALGEKDRVQFVSQLETNHKPIDYWFNGKQRMAVIKICQNLLPGQCIRFLIVADAHMLDLFEGKLFSQVAPQTGELHHQVTTGSDGRCYLDVQCVLRDEILR
jgi:hypothetical protein